MYSAVPLMSTGDWITAGWVNTYIGGNAAAIWVGSAAGDMAYYLSAVEQARLAKPSVDSILKNTSGGVPSWLAMNAIPEILHADAAVYFTGEHTTTPSSYIDKTGATVNVVTTRTCTIRMTAEGHIACGTGGSRTTVRGSIGGVTDPENESTFPWTSGTYYVPFSYVYKRTGVVAGTITCKLQFKSGGGTAYMEAGRIIVEAFAE